MSSCDKKSTLCTRFDALYIFPNWEVILILMFIKKWFSRTYYELLSEAMEENHVLINIL